jgi:hypothetical protein
LGGERYGKYHVPVYSCVVLASWWESLFTESRMLSDWFLKLGAVVGKVLRSAVLGIGVAGFLLREECALCVCGQYVVEFIGG